MDHAERALLLAVFDFDLMSSPVNQKNQIERGATVEERRFSAA